MIKYPMTVQGHRALEQEHEFLSKTERPRLSQAIGEARELGDLKENAEYHAAREEQGMVEARIRDIEGRLQNAVVIDVTTIPKTGKVIFGTTEGRQSIADSYSIRRNALQHKIYCTTTIAAGEAICEALKFGPEKTVRRLQDLHAGLNA